MERKRLIFKSHANLAPRIPVTGKDRDSINPGPSPEAIAKIERFEESSRRALSRLGTVMLR